MRVKMQVYKEIQQMTTGLSSTFVSSSFLG